MRVTSEEKRKDEKQKRKEELTARVQWLNRTIDWLVDLGERFQLRGYAPDVVESLVRTNEGDIAQHERELQIVKAELARL